MSPPNQLEPKIFPGDLAKLESIIERFEKAWQQGQPPAMEEYLREGDVEHRKLVIELAHVDLECRLKAGEAARVESYFERYADLADDRAAVLGLIEAEYQLRRRREPTLALDEYLRRFPQYREHLAERLRGPHLPAGRLPTQLNCPQCCKSIALGPGASEERVTCPSCGASFQLDPATEWSPVVPLSPALGEEPRPVSAGSGDPRRALEPPEGPPRLGQFELLEAIGQGAFGTVYRARDTELNRIVAVKMPRSGLMTTPVEVQRMVREARSAARLSHPGIVPVYEVSRGAPVPYIVSAYVEGETLAQLLQKQRLPFYQAADLAAQIAEALDHAHGHGVVHRDLKPSNIILGRIEGSGVRTQESGLRAGEPPVRTPDSSALTPEKRPYVMDFGLARQDEGEVRITLDGQILGTPAYMSPEQARGQSHQVDGRSDVYSLGVILYELLTGEIPFRGVARMVLQQILTEEPRPLRRLNDKIPRDLETITLKCLAKEPGRRYATAGALAGDLRHYLRGEPIQARPLNCLERLWRWSKRNPRVAVLSGAVLLLLTAVVLGSIVFGITMSQQRDEISRKRDEAVAARKTAKTEQHRAEKNAAIATQQREKAKAAQHQAEQQLDLTLHTLNNLIYEVHDHLLDDPAMFKLQERLVRTAIAGLERMARSAKGVEREHSMATAYGRMGDIFLLRGQTKEARKYYQLDLGVATRLRAAHPDSPKEKRAVSIATMRLGEISLAAGDTKQAGAYCRRALPLFEELARANPKDKEAHQDLVRCYKLFGQVEIQEGNARAARHSFHQAIKVGQTILAGHRHDLDVQLELAGAYVFLGDVCLGMNQGPSAREAFGKALELYQSWAAAKPDSARGKRSLALNYQKLGDIDVHSGGAESGRKHYAKACQWFEDLYQTAPRNKQVQRDLAVAYGKLGEACVALHDTQSALKYFAQARDRLQKLSDEAPQDALARRDVLIAYQKLGRCHLRWGNVPAARVQYRKALKGFAELSAAAPANVLVATDLAAANGNCGYTEMEAKEYVLAVQYFQRGVAILQDLDARGKLTDQPLYQGWLRQLRHQLAACQGADRAIKDLDFALAQPPAVAAELLQIRSKVLSGRGQHAAAALTAAKLHQLVSKDFNKLYEVGCCYALCAAAVAPGKKPDQLTPEEAAARARYTKRAIESLTEAVRQGFKDGGHLESDPDLVAIRAEKGYQKLVASLAKEK